MSRLPIPVLAALAVVGNTWGNVPAISADSPPAPDAATTAATLLADSGLPGGICVILDPGDSGLPLAIGQDPRFLVRALYQDPQALRAARQTMQAAGCYGRVSAASWDGGLLPYADNLVNLVVVSGPDSLLGDSPLGKEILRVLAPRGLVYKRAAPGRHGETVADRPPQPRSAGVQRIEAAGGWEKVVKAWPEDIDEWTHFLHGPDGNAVAEDRVVAPPQRYQWLADPAWAQSHESDTNLRCLVSAQGRIYYIVNEAPTSLAGPESPPDKWFLAARDAFNGVLLWKVPIADWGWREWKPSWFTPRPGVIPLNLDKRLVAAGDKVYATLGFRAPVSELDGRTGRVLRTFEGTERTSEILHVDDSLILTVLGDGDAAVQRIDLASGRRLWQSPQRYAGTTTDYYRFTAMGGSVPEARVDPTLAIATDGETIALLDGGSVAALNFSDGRQRWRTAFPLADSDHHAGRIAAEGKVWNGALIVARGRVVHASPNMLAAFSAQTGDVAWKQPKQFLQHLWYEWQDVFLIDGLVWTWSAELDRGRLEGGGNSAWPVSLNGYGLQDGQLQREVPLGNIFKTHHHHRCYRNKATVRYVIASRRGSEFVDLENGQHSVHNWVRGACHMGMVPANGLQYAPPHPCQCYIDEKLNGFNALAGGGTPSETGRSSRPRLERGPAYEAAAGAANGEPRGPSDWPTFRGDAARSGSVQTRLPSELTLLWTTHVGSRPAAPSVAGERVYVPAVDQHQLVVLDAKDGGERWRFTAGARIDSPPTVDGDAILFGSADGWVYRVRAADGAVAWRLRGNPGTREIAAFGQLESAWPVHGSVLLHEGSVYFAAGRSSQLDGGMRVIAADPLSGKIRHERLLSGPSYTVDNLEQNYRLPMGALPDILRVEDGGIFMRSQRLDAALQLQPGQPLLKIQDGFLDDAYFKRMPWSIGKSGHARVLVYDAERAFCLRMFDSLKGLDPKVYFTPGRDGYLLFASELQNGRSVWSHRIPIRGRALVATEDQLCVAGAPDVVDPADPLAAFEGRLGGILRVVGKHDGLTVSEHRLPSPPVFNGAAAADGRLYLTLEDGTVACFGHPR